MFLPLPWMVAAASGTLCASAFSFVPSPKAMYTPFTSAPPRNSNHIFQRNAHVRDTNKLNLYSSVNDEEEFDVGPDLLQIKIDVKEKNTKYQLLCEFIRLWADTFLDKKKSGLTTPVTVSAGANDGNQHSVQIKFKSTSAAFDSSWKEERAEEDDWGGSKEKKKPKAKKEGGVELIVERGDDSDGGSMVVRARRCNMDESTFVKEMSEEHILHKLKKSVQFWIKENK